MSYMSQTNVWRIIIFYYFLFLAEIYIVCVNVFYVVRNEISVESDKRQRISPNTPILQLGSIGKFLIFLPDPTQISFLTT